MTEAQTMLERTITVHEYLDGYEFRGDGGDYTPTDNEKELIEDAIEGYLGTLPRDAAPAGQALAAFVLSVECRSPNYCSQIGRCGGCPGAASPPPTPAGDTGAALEKIIIDAMGWHPSENGPSHGEAKADLLARLRALATIPAAIKEALEHYAKDYCEGWCKDAPPQAVFPDCGGCKARASLATTGQRAG